MTALCCHLRFGGPTPNEWYGLSSVREVCIWCSPRLLERGGGGRPGASPAQSGCMSSQVAQVRRSVHQRLWAISPLAPPHPALGPGRSWCARPEASRSSVRSSLARAVKSQAKAHAGRKRGIARAAEGEGSVSGGLTPPHATREPPPPRHRGVSFSPPSFQHSNHPTARQGPLRAVARSVARGGSLGIVPRLLAPPGHRSHPVTWPGGRRVPVAV
jgi:hypothetical protein